MTVCTTCGGAHIACRIDLVAHRVGGHTVIGGVKMTNLEIHRAMRSRDLFDEFLVLFVKRLLCSDRLAAMLMVPAKEAGDEP